MRNRTKWVRTLVEENKPYISVCAGLFIAFAIFSGAQTYSIQQAEYEQLKLENEALKCTIEEQNLTIERYTSSATDSRITYSKNLSDLKSMVSSLESEVSALTNKIDNLESNVRTYSLTNAEIDLLSRCAQAEAGYGNYDSQRYVVNVIMNRVFSDKFPNTVTQVIYQHTDSLYQFSVVKNGAIDVTAREDTVENVEDILIHSDFTLPENVVYFHATGTESNCTPYIECQGTTFGY